MMWVEGGRVLIPIAVKAPHRPARKLGVSKTNIDLPSTLSNLNYHIVALTSRFHILE